MSNKAVAGGVVDFDMLATLVASTETTRFCSGTGVLFQHKPPVTEFLLISTVTTALSRPFSLYWCVMLPVNRWVEDEIDHVVLGVLLWPCLLW